MIEDITNLGDSALLLPASVLLFCHLFWRGERSRALSFALALGACLAITVAAKLACVLLGIACFTPSLHSPSGHSSFSAVFYGCCAALVSSDDRPWRQRIVWIAVTGLILAIGVSRVLLGAHSSLEVAIGLAIGFACVRLFLRLSDKARPASGLLQVALGLGVLVIALQGTHLTIEPLLQAIADRWGLSDAPKCPAPHALAVRRAEHLL
jgi:membrane-associated phospholipid phosphatase